MQAHCDAFDGEWVVHCRDERVGLRAVIAIDDPALGPGLGGVRMGRYPHLDAGTAEAKRLAAAATSKLAFAGLPYGGAKSVILDPGRPVGRSALMRRFGEFVRRLDGAYVPGYDFGTTSQDMLDVGSGGAEVTCTQDDPMSSTAAGLVAAIEASVGYLIGGDLAGVRIVVQGASRTSGDMARLLAARGAHVLIGRPNEVVITPSDVLCVESAVIDADAAEVLNSRIVIGTANDLLVAPRDAETLADRGITYVPDFVGTAGGAIRVHGRRAGWDDTRVRAEVAAIGDRVRALLEESDRTGATPLHLARQTVATSVRLLRSNAVGAGPLGGPFDVPPRAESPVHGDGLVESGLSLR
ncbi:Glu/Leu/Phe/Val dehydrogenase dimerization domain-containing protein [Kutzneria buriramensis]|uniref:Leucine dehydrogenase n=1 Tax=Kutzneria buriramensis TaxID=1045776 RepID=A0A3E0HE92_9PSEU|nr:Glu/Leu/Phe/Val dehydrogenase dimerization domain-containing protein [Kutzneria buriramensis]REH43591.1 leucine dehydrogenase [Kutzneria buriramensis]